MQFLFLILIALLDVYTTNVLRPSRGRCLDQVNLVGEYGLGLDGCRFFSVLGEEERPNGFYAMDGVGHHGFRAGIHTQDIDHIAPAFRRPDASDPMAGPRGPRQ